MPLSLSGVRMLALTTWVVVLASVIVTTYYFSTQLPRQNSESCSLGAGTPTANTPRQGQWYKTPVPAYRSFLISYWAWLYALGTLTAVLCTEERFQEHGQDLGKFLSGSTISTGMLTNVCRFGEELLASQTFFSSCTVCARLARPM